MREKDDATQHAAEGGIGGNLHDVPRRPDLRSELPEMLEHALDGCTASKGWLYDRFAPKLLRRLRSRYQSAGLDAEELLHDAFVLFFQDDSRVLRSFVTRTPVSAQTDSKLECFFWNLACGIASNRRRSRRRFRPLPLLGADQRPGVEDAEQRNLDKDTLVRLDACLRRGNARVYLYYKMRFVDGLTPEEISQATGWSRKATYKLKLSLNQTIESCARKLGL